MKKKTKKLQHVCKEMYKIIIDFGRLNHILFNDLVESVMNASIDHGASEWNIVCHKILLEFL